VPLRQPGAPTSDRPVHRRAEIAAHVRRGDAASGEPPGSHEPGSCVRASFS
jgi:hypothetical protein